MSKLLGFAACAVMAAMLGGCGDKSVPDAVDSTKVCDPDKGECLLPGDAPADDAAEVEEEAAE